jgi:hypothetical protein
MHSWLCAVRVVAGVRNLLGAVTPWLRVTCSGADANAKGRQLKHSALLCVFCG